MSVKLTTTRELDVKNLTFTELIDSSKVVSQRICFIRHNGIQIHLQTPTLITEACGIPKISTFYPDDKSRAFYKLPFCQDRKKYDNEVDYTALEQFQKKLSK